MKRRVVSRTDYDTKGLVTNKVYADGKGPRYDYTPDGKLAMRIWARGIVTDYSYDNWGNLTNTVYTDNTPAITLFYDALGRQVEAHDAAGVTTFLYDSFGSLTNETIIGVAGTNTIIRYRDEFGRTAGYALNGIRQTTIAYEPDKGRIATMETQTIHSPVSTQNSNSFQWSYLDGSDLKSSLDYPNCLTASWTYDTNNQLSQVCNATSTNVISQYDYTYDVAGRRVQIARSGSAMSENRVDEYGYNIRNELISAVKCGVASSLMTEYAYQYDDIGNRIRSLDLGTNRTYTANNLNQYTSISNSAASVLSVGEFIPHFDDDMRPRQRRRVARRSEATEPRSGRKRPRNQTLIKTATGIWQVTYNGENRPIFWTNGATNIVMQFDRMGRRVEYLKTCGSATNANNTFTYDNYLLVARNRNNSDGTLETDRFIWDPTEPIATRPLVFYNSNAPPQYYTHDGNKNVSDLTDSTQNTTAHYEYAPFGALLSSFGSSALSNSLRFSSEYADDTLSLIYYNYRHLDPATGGWTNRDPADEMPSCAWAQYGYRLERNGYLLVNNQPSRAGNRLVECAD